MPFAATCMDLEVVLSEVNQVEKEKCYMISFIYRTLKKMTQINLLIKQKQIHRLQKQIYDCLVNLQLPKGKVKGEG